MRIESLSIPFWSAEKSARPSSLRSSRSPHAKVLAYPTETVYGFGGGIDRIGGRWFASEPAAGKAVPAAHLDRI
jgi:hypothetical protein